MKIHSFTTILVLSLISYSQTFAVNTDVQGTTYSISDGFFIDRSHPEGSHFHSTNLGELPPGNPEIIVAGVAEVGGFFNDEEVRGLSEFALQDTASTATVFFDVLDLFALGLSPEASGIDGLYGQEPYVGVIDMFAFAGNDAEDLANYQIAPISATPILTIDVGPGLIVAGETQSVDVTEIYNNLVAELAGNQAGAATALGVRLQMAPPADPNSGAITFGNFRLELQNQVVPEPTTSWSLLIGTAVMLWRSRQTRRI